MRDLSYRVALGGIVSALCLTAMFFAGIMPALYLLLPMVAGVLMMIIAVEVNTGWAWLTYIAVGLLSLFITFDKEASLIFIMLFGHYPIIKFYLDRIKSRFLRNLIKFAVFNVCAVSYFFVTVYIFGLDQMSEEFEEIGRYGSYVMLGLCNIIFVMYDLNLDMCNQMYRKKLMPRLKRKK
ncbi:MAG: hypothetical protein K2J36_04425 [Ruminococcus sp.]|nr:hypothetical protein [Ruminococcus sp.]MDE6671936.1 hypothetical protein [Ruminococcus sp.]MDE6797239.1 hypothetical protein [Ruminococcus sp.]